MAPGGGGRNVNSNSPSRALPFMTWAVISPFRTSRERAWSDLNRFGWIESGIGLRSSALSRIFHWIWVYGNDDGGREGLKWGREDSRWRVKI